jgi:hypothetical protein
LKILEINNQKIAEVMAEEVVVNDTQDALDMMANADYQGAKRIIMEEKHLNRDFFDLRTGLAGEILQKYSNYRMKLAVIGEFEKFKSNSLNAFIVECNRGNSVFFVPDKRTAISKIAGY